MKWSLELFRRWFSRYNLSGRSFYSLLSSDCGRIRQSCLKLLRALWRNHLDDFYVITARRHHLRLYRPQTCERLHRSVWNTFVRRQRRKCRFVSAKPRTEVKLRRHEWRIFAVVSGLDFSHAGCNMTVTDVFVTEQGAFVTKGDVVVAAHDVWRSALTGALGFSFI